MNKQITVIATKANGNVILFRASTPEDAGEYVREILARGWKAEVDWG
jgi:hypothetical protein